MVWLEIRDSGADLSVPGAERNLSRGEVEGEAGTLRKTYVAFEPMCLVSGELRCNLQLCLVQL